MKRPQPGNFIEAFAKLKKLAKKLRVNMEKVSPEFFQGVDALAGYCYDDNTVRYSSEINSNLELGIYIICHELGHALDYQDMSEAERMDFIENTRNYNDSMFMGLDFPVGMKDFILTSERIACLYAEEILNWLKIPYRKHKANKLKSQLLRSYRLMFID